MLGEMRVPDLTDAERADRVAAWFNGIQRERDLTYAAISRRGELGYETVAAIAKGRHKRGHPYVAMPETLWRLCLGMATTGRDNCLDEDLALSYYYDVLKAQGVLVQDDPAASAEYDALLASRPDLSRYLVLRRTGQPITASTVVSLRELLATIDAWRQQKVHSETG